MRNKSTVVRSLFLANMVLCLFSQSSLCAVPTPAEVIDIAKKGRLEFIRVTNDLQSTIPQIATKEELYPLIMALPELKRVSNDLDFASYGADPVLALAGVMTRNAVKWLRFDSDSKEFLTTFFSWADDQTRFSSAYLQTDFVKRAATKEALMKWSEGSSFSLKTIRVVKCEAWVREQFEELQAQVVMAILKVNQQFETSELAQVFSQIDGQMALAQVFGHIQQTITSEKKSEMLKAHLHWLGLLAANVVKNYENISTQVKLYPGQLMVEVLSKILTAGDSPELKDLKPILDILLPTQWVDLGTLMTELYSHQAVPAKQIGFVKEILGALKTKYEEFNIPGRKEALQQLADKILVSGVINEKDAEGIYELTIGERKGVFILSSTGNGKFIIAVTIQPKSAQEYEVDYGFFHLSADPATGNFEAHHFEQGSPTYPHRAYQTWDMTFSVTAESNLTQLQGELKNNQVSMKFSGVQTLKFSSVLDKKGSVPSQITGLYRGVIGDKPVELQLVRLGGDNSVAKLIIDYVNLPFNYGYLTKNDSTLVLTTGELDTYKWAQIKGRFSEDGLRFEGFYVMSGKAQVTQVLLKRVD